MIHECIGLILEREYLAITSAPTDNVLLSVGRSFMTIFSDLQKFGSKVHFQRL